MNELAYRDHNFLGITRSLCPDCLDVVDAKIIEREGRVYFRKFCREHGPREDFVCSDASWFDRADYSLPGKVPLGMAIAPHRGCPFDCGLCTEHEQHTCIGLLEITSACNLECPMCFAVSGPGGHHVPRAGCIAAIDRLVEVEGRPEILQLSGGEPTLHPQFAEILRYACEQPIDIVMINTNGIRLAHDPTLLELLSSVKHRIEVYLQFDGFEERGTRTLRGESVVETKQLAIERLGEAGIRTTLVATVHPGANDHQLGAIVDFASTRPWITGASFQPATYCGRHVLPEELERRVTFPDIIHGICAQAVGDWQPTDFTPLPCAHPNGHTLAYAFRTGGTMTPLARFVDIAEHLDLLSGRITFNRERAQALIQEYLSRQCCGGAGGCGPDACDPVAGDALVALTPLPPTTASEGVADTAKEFFERALVKALDPEDMFRVTTTSFMDAYNFDLRQLMKSCVHHVLPSGHIIPFSAYNVLYRPGHVPLPDLPPVASPAVTTE